MRSLIFGKEKERQAGSQSSELNDANERLTPQGSCPFRFALFSRAVFAGEQNRPLIRVILFDAKRRREQAADPPGEARAVSSRLLGKFKLQFRQ